MEAIEIESCVQNNNSNFKEVLRDIPNVNIVWESWIYILNTKCVE